EGRTRGSPYPDASRRLPSAGRCRSVHPDGNREAPLHVVHTRGVRSLILHGGCGAAVIRSTVACGGFRDDRVVPAIEQSRPGLFHLVDAGSASRRRRRRPVRPLAIILSELSRSRTPAALAAGDRLPGRVDCLLVLHSSAVGSSTFSG